MRNQPTRCLELRRRRGWTQRHLADVSAVSERTVQRLERGLTVSLESTMAIAAALDVTAAELSSKPQTMFPVDLPTLRALLRRNAGGGIGLGVAPDVAVPDDVLASVSAALRSRRSLSKTLAVLDQQQLRLLAAEVPSTSGAAVGFMLAPLTGAYSAAWRTA